MLARPLSFSAMLTILSYCLLFRLKAKFKSHLVSFETQLIATSGNVRVIFFAYFVTRTGGGKMQNIFDVECGSCVDCFNLHCNGIVFVHFVHSSEQVPTRRWRLVFSQVSFLETTGPALANVIRR